MTTQSEYEYAREWIRDQGWEAPDRVFYPVIRALRIAHRLTQEPSEEVITILERSDLTAEEAYADMAAELLKEESEHG